MCTVTCLLLHFFAAGGASLRFILRSVSVFNWSKVKRRLFLWHPAAVWLGWKLHLCKYWLKCILCWSYYYILLVCLRKWAAISGTWPLISSLYVFLTDYLTGLLWVSHGSILGPFLFFLYIWGHIIHPSYAGDIDLCKACNHLSHTSYILLNSVPGWLIAFLH